MFEQQQARRFKRTPQGRVHVLSFAVAFATGSVILGGCAQFQGKVPPSEGHITAPPQQQQAATAQIPAPARAATLVPPPTAQVKPQTYSVVVHEVPVKELLLALARDTKQNIDIHPGLAGLVSLNAINETLPAILERLTRQVNMRYRTEGNTIVVTPDIPYVKTYRVNYVNMTRDTTSSIGVSGEISTGSSSGGGSSGGGGSGGSSGGSGGSAGSTTTVRSSSTNNFWDALRDNIRGILNSTRLQTLSADARAERRELIKQEQDLRVRQIEAASRAGQGAPNLASNTISAPGSQTAAASLLPDDVVVNAVSGTITVNATDAQHQLVQRHIDSVTASIQRQVLIEATIVEVALSDAFQAGIDWSRLPISGGVSITQSLLGGFNAAATGSGATAGNSLTVAYTNPTTNLGNISGTVRLLETFGNSRVLSSPKLMAMNNQTALLKVVDNLVYFEIQAQTNTTQGVASTTFNSNPKFVSVGVVMGVTPQINEDGRVQLNVRPTVTRLNTAQPFVNDPNPSLCDAARVNCIANPVPQIQVREMESVLQVVSGQTVILGGLMQDNTINSREQIPGADSIGSLGDLFRFRDQRARKTELVIFLRPTVVTNPTLASDELKQFQRFLPQLDSNTGKTTP
ncbi:MAG: secretin N-terminal domain-containing protein [Burkholderiales bacterium]|nr:secretin N-terminal domain-containing protein [Burkholderiales bacterium]